MDEKSYKKCEWDGEDLFIFDNLFSGINNEEAEAKLINFIFNPDSWHDCYEDNYGECPYEDEIPNGNETLWERDG